MGRRRLSGSAPLVEGCHGEDVSTIVVCDVFAQKAAGVFTLCNEEEMRDGVDSQVEGIGDVDRVADFTDDGVDGGEYEYC